MTLKEQLAWNKKNLEYKAKQKKITQERNEDDEFGFDDETKKNIDPSNTSYMKKRTDVNARHGLLPEVDEASNASSLKKSATVNDSLFD